MGKSVKVAGYITCMMIFLLLTGNIHYDIKIFVVFELLTIIYYFMFLKKYILKHV